MIPFPLLHTPPASITSKNEQGKHFQGHRIKASSGDVEEQPDVRGQSD